MEQPFVVKIEPYRGGASVLAELANPNREADLIEQQVLGHIFFDGRHVGEFNEEGYFFTDEFLDSLREAAR